jgi:hypothetical protein
MKIQKEIEDNYKEGQEYNWKELKQKTTGKANLGGLPFRRVKQFTAGYTYKSNGKTAKCQVKGCYEKGLWLTEHKGKTILLCFNHGEEA